MERTGIIPPDVDRTGAPAADFPVPAGAAQALERLHRAGHEAWLVGGCVRDRLLGREPKDYDVTTSALPEETERVFAGETLIETGLKHGTVTVILAGEPVEITTYRVDGTYSDGRRPDSVTFTRSLAEDAARRDFTINAMAYAPDLGLWDGCGGREDLDRGLIRCVGDPETRFREDALRILRALRFAAQLDFALEPATLAAARKTAPLLKKVAAERITAELEKLLCGPAAGRVLTLCPDILGTVLPELAPLAEPARRTVPPGGDLLLCLAASLDRLPPRLTVRLAALLRCGERLTGSAAEGDGPARRILDRLRFPRRVQEESLSLTALWEREPEAGRPGVLRRLSQLGERLYFDWLDLRRAEAPSAALDGTEALARSLLAEGACLSVRDLAVNGRDLLALGWAGPSLGRAMEALLIRVQAGELPNRRDALLSALGRMTGGGEREK